jgi:hypothetical protein
MMAIVLFGLPTWFLGLTLLTLLIGSAMTGLLIGRRLSAAADKGRESFGVLQATLIAFMGLILAFGLSLAVGRYEARRAAAVAEANTIGTAYLRAQALDEPVRSQSLAQLVAYTDIELKLSHVRPGSDEADAVAAEASASQRHIWRLTAQAVREQPTATAPKLYQESVNEMFDAQAIRVNGLNNRVPGEVLFIEILGAAIALGLLGLHVGVLGRGIVPLALAAVMVALLLFTIMDLDRPNRGFIRVPDTALAQVRASMELPPAAG